MFLIRIVHFRPTDGLVLISGEIFLLGLRLIHRVPQGSSRAGIVLLFRPFFPAEYLKSAVFSQGGFLGELVIAERREENSSLIGGKVKIELRTVFQGAAQGVIIVVKVADRAALTGVQQG